MDILEIISRRVSVRNYQPEPVETAEIQEVLNAGERAETLTHAELRFHLRSNEEMGREVKGIFSRYGKIICAPHYIVLVARESEGYLVDAGYRFEQVKMPLIFENHYGKMYNTCVRNNFCGNMMNFLE